MAHSFHRDVQVFRHQTPCFHCSEVDMNPDNIFHTTSYLAIFMLTLVSNVRISTLTAFV